MNEDKKLKARARALRAARAVSIAAALAVGPMGCSMSHERPGGDSGSLQDSGEMPPYDAGEMPMADAFVPMVDAGYDAGGDAGTCPPPTFTDCCEPMPEACCTSVGFWDSAANCCVTCVVGPLVPPSAAV